MQRYGVSELPAITISLLLSGSNVLIRAKLADDVTSLISFPAISIASSSPDG